MAGEDEDSGFLRMSIALATIFLFQIVTLLLLVVVQINCLFRQGISQDEFRHDYKDGNSIQQHCETSKSHKLHSILPGVEKGLKIRRTKRSTITFLLPKSFRDTYYAAVFGLLCLALYEPAQEKEGKSNRMVYDHIRATDEKAEIFICDLIRCHNFTEVKAAEITKLYSDIETSWPVILGNGSTITRTSFQIHKDYDFATEANSTHVELPSFLDKITGLTKLKECCCNWITNFLQNLLSVMILIKRIASKLPITNTSDACSNLRTKHTKKLDSDEYNSDVMSFVHSLGELRIPATNIHVHTVAKYPDNHNHLLPLKLIKKLDAMSPQEFLKYVLEELTLEERESLMVDERQRRKSFQVGWPYDGNLSGIKLAQAGFYSVNDYDRVQCVFCRGSLHRWEREDVPMIEHARSFNFCRFVKGLSCGNIEYRSDKLTKEDMRNITKFKHNSSSRYDSSRSDLTDSSALGISTNRAAMIEYAVYESRIKTFSRWPKTSSMTPKALCEAGFYYTGFDDMVRCFYCAGAIREWAITDDPHVEHARWFPDCSYLIQVKTTQFVDQVHASTPANKKSVRQTKAEKIAIKKADQAQTIQVDMIETCISLGKAPEDIKAAIERHGGRFDSVRNMLDEIYAIEDGTTAQVASTPKLIIPRLATDSLDSK